MKLLRRHYWLLVSPAYSYLAFRLIWYASPPSVDGSGPLATFYWGKYSPTPTLVEYSQSQSVRLTFLFPYWIAAAVITLLGCGVTRWVMPATRLNRSRLFLISSAVSMSLFMLAAAMSDFGTGLGLWFGGKFYSDLFSVAVLFKITLPISIATGLLSVVHARFADWVNVT